MLVHQRVTLNGHVSSTGGFLKSSPPHLHPTTQKKKTSSGRPFPWPWDRYDQAHPMDGEGVGGCEPFWWSVTMVTISVWCLPLGTIGYHWLPLVTIVILIILWLSLWSSSYWWCWWLLSLLYAHVMVTVNMCHCQKLDLLAPVFSWPSRYSGHHSFKCTDPTTRVRGCVIMDLFLFMRESSQKLDYTHILGDDHQSVNKYIYPLVI